MDMNDIKLMAALLVGVILLVVVTMLAPVYVMPDDVAVRRFYWNAPTRPVARQYDKMSPDEIRSFESDPFKKGILEAMKNQPTNMPYDHYYLGSIGDASFNVLGYFTALCSLCFAAFVGYKLFRLGYAKLEVMRNPPPKKQPLPYDVRRLGEKRRR